jgi:hypothetical protein
MRHIGYIAGAAALAMALAGCGEPYYPGYRTQAYYAPSGYSYAPSGYSYAPSGYAEVPASSSSYSSRSDYYRNYNGIHAAPERTFP